MKNTMKLIATAVIALGTFAASSAMAQTWHNSTGQNACTTCAPSTGQTATYGRVIIPIKAVATEDLNFGAYCAPQSGSGYVTIVPDMATGSGDGGTVAAGSLVGLTQNGIGHDLDGDGIEEARFLVTGEPGLSYTRVASFSSLTGTTGNAIGHTMSVTNPTYKDNSGSTTSPGSLPASGSQWVNVGGTLNVPSTQQSGIYTGTVSLTVAY